jgi:hypothetical protein
LPRAARQTGCGDGTCGFRRTGLCPHHHESRPHAALIQLHPSAPIGHGPLGPRLIT